MFPFVSRVAISIVRGICQCLFSILYINHFAPGLLLLCNRINVVTTSRQGYENRFFYRNKPNTVEPENWNTLGDQDKVFQF